MLARVASLSISVVIALDRPALVLVLLVSVRPRAFLSCFRPCLVRRKLSTAGFLVCPSIASASPVHAVSNEPGFTEAMQEIEWCDEPVAWLERFSLLGDGYYANVMIDRG